MNAEQFRQAVDRLKEVNQVLEGLDASVRADAFDLLKPYVVGDAPAGGSGDAKTDPGRNGAEQDADDVDSSDFREFMGKHENHDKPSENVYAIAAWWYSQYGLAPIGRATVNQLASEIGAIVPARPDKTLRTSTLEGKPRFQKKGKGFAPTITGEQWLRTTYKVRKGTGTPPEPTADS